MLILDILVILCVILGVAGIVIFAWIGLTRGTTGSSDNEDVPRNPYSDSYKGNPYKAAKAYTGDGARPGKKYKLTKNTKIVDGRTLYQIKATMSFGTVMKGDLGGWIESEKNLCHRWDAWVFDNACVYGNGRVGRNAKIENNVKVFDDAVIYGNALITGNAQIFGQSRVEGNAYVSGNVKIYERATVTDSAIVRDDSEVFGDSRVDLYASVFKTAKVSGGSHITNHANVEEDCDGQKITGETDFCI